jgi:outer membrane biosynthesis protein TonB
MRLASFIVAALLTACAEPLPASVPAPTPAPNPDSRPAPQLKPSPEAKPAPELKPAPEPNPAPEPKPAPSPADPQGSTLTNAVTTSSSSVADADRAILAVRPKLRRCYEVERGTGPEIVGMVTCGVRITKSGKVGAVGVTRRSVLPNPLVDCIIKELGTAVFEPRAEEAVIMVPVRFGELD